MDDSMARVLGRLEKRSGLEKSRRVDVRPDRRMLAITRETGELINLILFVTKAKNILEIGMSVGYSTLWCADIARKNSGRVFTIEKNQGKIDRARRNFADAGVAKNISILKGTALEVLGRLGKEGRFRGFFDFVLIDADKENVIRYFDMVVPLVRRGGIIMTDNMLYPEKYRGEMRGLSEHIRKNPGIRTITCPVGNGEEISVKV